ncbi:hypothetical protein C8Q80DRAFT_1204109 [Daedaleopsis nitida]|nr:hypothetical protein C8Q80DRAFT_1204109 [Daedaleopsis nitida]
MFSSAVQPSLVSLFSSTGSDPLSLFASRTDEALPSDSFICLLNDSTSRPPPPSPCTLITTEDESSDASPNYSIDQTALHIQSPTLRTTYIRSPPALVHRVGGASSSRGSATRQLGLKHPWIHLQVRNMEREWAFEVGILDQSGHEGVIRCATYQVRYLSLLCPASTRCSLEL